MIRIVSTTTRAMRPGEVEGEDYYSISVEEHMRLRNEGQIFGLHYSIAYVTQLKYSNNLHLLLLLVALLWLLWIQYESHGVF